jgi:hypothetical protein
MSIECVEHLYKEYYSYENDKIDGYILNGKLTCNFPSEPYYDTYGTYIL